MLVFVPKVSTPGSGSGPDRGGGTKGTTNWPETAHRAIWPRAKSGKKEALGPPLPKQVSQM